MTLNEYQERAMQTCMESSANFAYMMLNLVGEVGEFAGKVAKAIRKKHVRIGYNVLASNITDNELIDVGEYEDQLKKEAGDILWQLAGLCDVMGWELNTIAEINLSKLAARKAAGTIDGNGDGISGKERTV